MLNRGPGLVAPVGLVIGGLLGMAGTFVHSVPLRGILWGFDGIALTVAAALLTIHHIRQGNDTLAAGFLLFALGEILVHASDAMDLVAGSPIFAAGASLWAASLIMISVPNIMPLWVRLVGTVAAILFAVATIQVFAGSGLTPLSHPLPFFAYPFLVATVFGWAWVHYRTTA